MWRLTSKLKTVKVVLVCILILAACLRFYGLNWDQGYHLHPDERWLTMVAGHINWPQNLSEFLSVDSPLNPKFFAYGSLPIYLLRFAGNLAGFLSPQLAQYNNLNLLGRMLSVFFDLGTLLLVFLLGRKVWNKKVGLLAAFFYAIAVFPIQNAHFYTVDTQLTFWVTLALFFLVKFLGHPNQKTAAVIGIAFGAALATKITAVFLLPSVLLALVFVEVRWDRRGRRFRESICSLVSTLGITFFTFILLQPYVLIDFSHFKSDVLLQSQMSRDATIFPYTIQYIGTTPYVYQLKNLVLWGLGAPLGVLGILGILWLTIRNLRSLYKRSNQQSTINNQQSVLLVFFWAYFIVTGASAVKFMRYLLPLYPILTLAAASLTLRVKSTETLRVFPAALWSAVLGTCAVWTFAFMQIYVHPHTRVSASNWINQNIPTGSILATEHWDDGLPLFGFEKYENIKFNLYDSDNAEKVDELINKIVQVDYIILSSNRLYASIPKLPNRYPVTIRYYELLFSEKLGFEKIKEFTSYPHLIFDILHFEFRDSGADESFTVYDHPKVMIFKKTKRVDAGALIKW